MTTIRIASDANEPKDLRRPNDEEEPERSIYEHRQLSRSNTIQTDDGIVNMRTLGKPGFLARRQSLASNLPDEDPGLRQSSDFGHKQEFKGRYLIWLAYQSVGVIYGDIGTSPLYVFSSTFSEAPTKQNLVGVLSLIIWSMSIMVTIKYVLIILHADNDGEGGSFSTYALLCRYMNITRRDPREATMVEMKRIKTGELQVTGQKLRSGIEHSRFVKKLLQVVGILAVTMVIADGVLTPAQSVLGAVQGISVVRPSISKPTILGVTNAILVLLFAIQPLGISRMTVAFSPIVIIWLGFNFAFGIYNVVIFDATVFKAFNPYFAFDFLIRNGHQGWRQLGGVLLSFTGVEALFADLGAFSRQAIQLSWLCYAYPCLLLAYIGQAAYISVHPDAYSNPFFNSVPPGMLYPSLVVAILAAIVASQAIITATFQLLAQAMKLSYVPQIKVIHTSKTFHGQLFIPLANWVLMLGCILVASIYNNTTSLGNAYGVCVMFVTFFDTCMVTLAAIFVWRYSPWLVALPWLIFACHDGTYLTSALEKVPRGAWFTLCMAALIAIVFLIWRFGKESQWQAEAEDRFPTSHFVRPSVDGRMQLTERFDSTPLSNVKGLGIFFDKAGETTPTVFSQFALKLTALPEVMIFFHLRPLERPFVSTEDRYSTSRLAIPNCYRVVVRHGYNDVVVSDDLASILYHQVRTFIESREGKDGGKGKTPEEVADNDKSQAPTPASSATADELARLDQAYEHKVLYVVGKELMKTKKGTSWFRAGVLWAFLWMRENTRGKMADLKLPADNLIEVGFLKEI
ncbi:High affinity potassium transporter-like protein [Elsinoe fawcettii]|nr:High affinity potassium transporter-like protein [Elsinoe fawcettii]